MTQRSSLTLLSLALVATAPARGARADAVPDIALPTCPAGAVATRDHSVTYCAPAAACTADADCSTGHCEATSFCLGDVGCGGDSEPSCRHVTVESTCEPGSTCPGGACETARRCVPGPVARAVSTCAAAPRTAALPGAGWTAAVGAAILVARTRRRARTERKSPCR